jgi:hypothetical protein
VTDEIYSEDWEIARTYLRSRFRRGVIVNATRKDLERAIVILAHAADKDAWPHETEIFRSTVSQLLQVRISEELHWRSMVAAAVAAAISALALLVAGLQAWDAHQLRVDARHPKSSLSPPATPVPTPMP